MDEKEQADRLAAAEALFMISNRGEKPQLPIRPRPTRRGKKQKVVDYDDITASKKRTEESINSRSRSRSKSSDGANPSNDRGRGRRGGLSTRSRGRGRGKKHTNTGRNNKSRYGDSESDDNNLHSLTIDTETSPSPEPNDQVIPKTQRGRGKKRGGKSKTKSHSRTPKLHSQEFDVSNTVQQGSVHAPAIGLSGASLSESGPSTTESFQDVATSAQPVSSANLPSLGLVSGFNKVSLGKSQAGAESSTALPLPSINLTSLTEGNLPSLNLPSLPSEYPFLQLSSQPTPNLSSLGDLTVTQTQLGDVDPQPHREKSEKFLPLKKRKLHKAEESSGTGTAAATDSPVDGLSVSDSEERYEAISPEPARAPFTVQAPPIITMQTLMEIKTALQADDDGDLPLHIAVVHENMRMVAKLISLMRIAGKTVDKFNKQQQTPLHLAIKLDFTEAVELLLKSGADVNAVDCSGSSAIHMAVQGRSNTILRLLLEKCPNVELNNRNIDGLTPLHLAVDNGDLEQADLLLKNGAHIDITDGKSGRTPLFRAAESNHKQMVEMLLKRGASVDVASYAGVTVSMAAQGRNLHGVLKLLGSVQDKFGVNLEAASTPGPSRKSPLTVPPPLLYMGVPGSPKPSPLPSGLVSIGQASSMSPPVSINSPVVSVLSTPGEHSTGAVKKEAEPLTYLVRSPSKVGRADMTSGGVMLERADPGSVTKVFHNIFMLTDDKQGRVQMESVSEPSSPDTRMEVDMKFGSWRKDKSKGGGLLSLPETLDTSKGDLVTGKDTNASGRISTLEGTLAKPAAAVIQTVTIAPPKPSGSPGRETSQNVANNFVGRISSDGVIHLVPSSSVSSVSSSSSVSTVPVSKSTISKLALRPSLSSSSWKHETQVMTSSSSILLPVLSTSLSSSPVLPSSPSSSSPKPGSALPPQGGDPATTSLSSIQAKLYETLLRRSHSLPAGANSTAPQEASVIFPPTMSKLLVSPSLAGPVSYRVVPTDSVSGRVSEPLSTRRETAAAIPLIRVPSLAHMAKSTSSSPSSSPPNTPLNLSKSSSSKSGENSVDLIEGSSAPNSYQIIETIGKMRHGSGPLAPQGGSSGEHPGQPTGKPVRKVISVDMSRAPGPSKVSSGSGGFQGQYEMYLVPQDSQRSSDKPADSAAAATKTSSTRPSIVVEPAVVANMTKGELNLSNFPHISKCVRDLLSRQNQLLQKSPVSSSSSSAQTTVAVSTVAPATSVSPSLVSSQHPAGRIVLPPGPVVHNNIVGLSGAILSVVTSPTAVPSKIPETALQSEEQRDRNSLSQKKSAASGSQKEQPQKKTRGGRGGNKLQRGGQHMDASGLSSSSAMGNNGGLSGEPIPNLGKINSETDEKLKRFLVAKRQDGLMSAKGTGSELQGTPPNAKDRKNEIAGESAEDRNSLKTVGIFSGNVQKVKLGKSRVSTTSPASPAVSSCVGSTSAVSVGSTSAVSVSTSVLSVSNSVQVVISSSAVTVMSGGDNPPVKQPNHLTQLATEKTATTESTDQTNSEDDDDGEESMEIDIPDESESGKTAPDTTATSASLKTPKVQIIVESPTPPLPTENVDAMSEVSTQNTPAAGEEVAMDDDVVKDRG